MKIPNDNRWTQINDGDIFGLLHETHNITFDKKGVLRLSKKPFARYSSDNDAELGYILSIVYLGGQYLALTDDRAFSFDLGLGGVTNRTISSDVGLNSDMVVCYDRAYMSTNDNIDYFNNALSLTQTVYATTASVPHPMCVFDSFTTYKLAIGDDNVVHLLDSSHNTSGTDLSLPEQYQVTSMAYRNGYLYIATKHTNGGEARIFVWDGNTANANAEIPVAATWIYSIIPYKSTVACITNQGQLLVLDGNTATQVASLPVYNEPDAIWDDGSNVSYIGKVMNRGMVAVGDLIYLNINGTVDSGEIPEMKHGLWVYDPAVGLYHRSAFTSDQSVVETPSGLSSNTLTLSTHYLKTGDTLMFRDIGSLTGVQANTVYYVKVESATTVKLAITRKALEAAEYITIGGSVGVASAQYAENRDHGLSHDSGSYQGAISMTYPEEPVQPGWESPVVWGARTKDLSDSAFYGLYSFTNNWNIGRFSTQKILAKHITEAWERIALLLNGLHLSNEEIIVKYKAETKHGYPTQIYGGQWTAATTLESVAGSQDEDEWSDLAVGDELTITDGLGRGHTTHITAISESGGTYTVTVDESLGVNGETVEFYADNFKKIGSYGNGRELTDILDIQLEDVKAPWIQFKVELRGYEPEVYQLDVSNRQDKG